MAAAVKGTQVLFGILAAAKTNSDATVTAGIVESYSVQLGGSTEEIGDEDNDIVARVDHAPMNKVTLEVLVQSTSVMPAKGTVITGLSTVQGVALGTGSVIVDDAQVTFAKAGVTKLTVSATHYPSLTIA
jgi:hypothetical protein